MLARFANEKGNAMHKTLKYLAWVGLAVLISPPVSSAFKEMEVRWVYIFSFSFLASVSLTPVFRTIARRYQIMDIPNERKSHQLPTPLLGGVAIYVGFVTSMLLNNIIDRQILAILLSATFVMVTSLIDDIKRLSAAFKLLIQILATGVIIASGIRIILLPQNLLGHAVNYILTVLWVVGITNAMNFLDGLDGLAAGLGAIIAFFLGVVAFQTNQPFLGWFAIALLGSCLGFLPFNFRVREPASIFLGDAGSTFIGFTLACLAIKGEWAIKNPIVSLCAPILIFGIPIFDMTHTTIRRILSGKVKTFNSWIAYAAKDHVHHRMQQLFQSKKKSVLLIYSMSACLGISAVVLRNARTIDAVLIVLQGIIVFIIFSLIEARRQ